MAKSTARKFVKKSSITKAKKPVRAARIYDTPVRVGARRRVRSARIYDAPVGLRHKKRAIKK